MNREAAMTLVALLFVVASTFGQETTQEKPKAPGDPRATRTAQTLSWEELSVRLVGLDTSAGLQIDVTPLDEDAIVLAAEDIYAYLSDVKLRGLATAGYQPEDVDEFTIFLVAFTGFEKEISFDPTRLIIFSEGSTFYPVRILPVSPTFDRRLVGLYETVYGLYMFEPGIDFFANLEFQYADLTSGESWRGIVERVQRAKARRQTEINGPSS